MPRGGLAGCQGCVWWRERGGWLCVGGVGRCWLGGCVWCVWGWGREGCEEERRGACGAVVGCVLLAGGSLLAGRPTHPLSLPPPPPAPHHPPRLASLPPSLPSFLPSPHHPGASPTHAMAFRPPSSLSPSLSLSLPLPPPGAPASAAPLFPTRRAVQAVCAGASGRGRRGEVSGWRVCGCGCRVRERATAGARPLPLPRPLALPCANGGGSGRGGRGGGRPSSPEGAGRVCGSDRGVVCGVWCVVCGVVWWGAVCVCGVRRGVVVVGGPETPACCCCCPATPRTHTHTHTHTHSTPRRGAAQPRVTYSGSRNGLCWGVCRLYLGARGWRRRRRGRRG